MDADPLANIDKDGVESRKPPSAGNNLFKVIILAVAVAATVFMLDIMLPLGIAGGVPYVALVLVGWWFPKRQAIFSLAVISSLLTVIGYFLSPEGGIPSVVITNRAYALFAIWATTIILWLARRDRARILRNEVVLEYAIQESETSNKAKSDFLANMSHELRTPLNAIIGFSEAMMGKIFGPIGDKYTEYAGDINQSGQHLLLLINEILDLSKIESRSIDLHFETIQLSKCINDCMTIIRPQAEKEGITIAGDCLCNSTVEVHADPTRLLQVIINILSNAVKYNKPGGSIEIWCKENHKTGMGRLYIKDTGLGIPEAYKEIIFDPFSRDPHTAWEKEGTGIGLSIAKSLMKNMNGEIGFESTVGEGTTFWIDIPLVDNSAAT